MAILNKIQVKGVLYEIEDSNAIHGTLKTVNGESLHGTGDIVTVGKATEQNGEVFNDYENNVANGTYSSAIGNSTIANNFAEHASGQFNVSNSGAEGKNNTLSSIGIGTSDDSRKNAFEVMRNGDLYVYGIGEYDGTNPIQTNSLQTIINQSLDDIESKVDKTTTVNGKPLSSNIVIDGTDIIVGGDSDYRTDSLAEAFKKVDDFIGDAQSYAVTSFGGQTGDITLQLDSETNGDINFIMFNKELRGTVVGLKSAAYTEAQNYATAAQGLKADSAVQSVRESNTGTNISILASKTGNIINLTPSLIISTVSSNGTGLTTASDVKSYVDTSINNLDKTAVTAETGQVISSVSQSNGIISASVKTLAEVDIPTLSQSKISGLTASLNAKQNTITGAASTVATNNLAANRALVSDAGGKIAVSVVTSTELAYLDGVTSNIQTQLNAKANTSALSAYALKSGSNASGTWPISISGNAATATKLAAARSLWGRSFDGSGNVSGDMIGVGRINNGLIISQFGTSADNSDTTRFLINGHQLEFGGYGYAHQVYYFRPQYSANGETYADMYIQNASASDSPVFSTTHAFDHNGNVYHWGNLGLGTVPSSSYKLNVAGTGYFSGLLTASGGLFGLTKAQADSYAGNSNYYNLAVGQKASSMGASILMYRDSATYQSFIVWSTKTQDHIGIGLAPSSDELIIENHKAGIQLKGKGNLTYNDYPLLHSNNYTSYTVTKTGGGASGTWNINISGTAASANSVAWNNVSGKPSSFTPASHTHTASQVSGLAKVATSGNYNDLINKPNIPAAYTLPVATASVLGGVKIGSGVTISSGVISVSCSSIGAATSGHTHSQYLTSSSLSGYATQSWVNSQGFIKSATDTKNTAGSTNTSSKLFLIGATSQATSPVTYSNSSVYTQSGQLYATRMYATNGFYETSDARLKDFKDDIKALEVVSEIPTKYFIWKSDKSKTEHIGTSAQEIQKLYPDLVTENEDGVLSVDYARLSIIALAAIKELKAQIDELKSKIN